MTEQHQDPHTGPFSWTDIYRAVERSEDRIMKRFDELGTDLESKTAAAASEREAIRGRVALLEQRNAIEDARNRGLSSFGSIGLKFFLTIIAFSQLAIAAYLVLAP